MHNAESLRKLLGQNAKLTARAKAHGDRIRAAAAEELAQVEARLSGLTAGGAFTSEVNAAMYRRLIEDRARLHQLLRGTEA